MFRYKTKKPDVRLHQVFSYLCSCNKFPLCRRIELFVLSMSSAPVLVISILLLIKIRVKYLIKTMVKFG